MRCCKTGDVGRDRSWHTGPVPPLASPQLAQFLATEDLDDLLEAVQDVGPLSGDDEQVVR